MDRHHRGFGAATALRLRLAGAIFLFGAVSAPAARADVVRLLRDDYEAAQARVDIIQQAQIEVSVVYYIVDFDNVSAMLLAALRVRMVIDASKNTIPDAMQAHLIERGVEIREYHQGNLLHPCWINRRLHDKVVLSDRCQLITGSRNMEDRHFGLACRNFCDRDVYLCGQVACEATKYFECLWASNQIRPTKLKNFSADCPNVEGGHYWLAQSNVPQVGKHDVARGKRWASAYLDQAWAILAEGEMITLNSGNDWSAGRPQLPPIPFLYDPGGRKRTTVGTDEVMLDLVNSAQRSIVIETPYFVASRKLRQALLRAAARGVEIQILTNSLTSTNSKLSYGAYSNQKRMLMRHGIKLWEFRGPCVLHAKSMVVDCCISVVGSYNFDPRSENLNTEVAVLVKDCCFAQEVRASIAAHQRRAYPIASDGTALPTDVRHPGADAKDLRELHSKKFLALFLKGFI
jgi:phosphatidylserine/phosphatidylglycerophosphate/cardiolipin synthase-like enzyme